MDEIPKDLRRWLKDNGHYMEFNRLVKVCGYKLEDLCKKYDGKYEIIKWFNIPIEKRAVICKGSENYDYNDFLDSLKLNWK